MTRKLKSFKMSDERIAELKELAEIFGINERQVIEQLIQGEYIKVSGKQEEIHALMNQMKDITRRLEDIANEKK